MAIFRITPNSTSHGLHRATGKARFDYLEYPQPKSFDIERAAARVRAARSSAAQRRGRRVRGLILIALRASPAALAERRRPSLDRQAPASAPGVERQHPTVDRPARDRAHPNDPPHSRGQASIAPRQAHNARRYTMLVNALNCYSRKQLSSGPTVFSTHPSQYSQQRIRSHTISL